jgi:hypothetical protein
MKTNAKFAPGDVLTTRSICNHDCIYTATVVSRTAKSVMVDLGSGHGGIVRRGLLVDDYTGNEYFFPYGRYSMAPSFSPPVPRPFDNPGDAHTIVEENPPANVVPFRDPRCTCDAECNGPVPNYCPVHDGNYSSFLAANNCD